jgi:ankyrin repeat protein
MSKISRYRNRPSRLTGPYERANIARRNDNDSLDELRTRAKALAATSTWPKSVIARMTKAELIELLSEHDMENSAAAQAPQVRAPMLCASDQVGSVRELRKMAREQGIAHANTMTKQELCRALHIKLELAQDATIQNEEVEIPEFALDVLTQDVLVDPVVAEDGHTYGYHSLRGLFVTEVNRFHQAGKPASKPIRVMSPLNPAIRLSNPFDDIPDLPRDTPLFRSITIRRQIREWLAEHGLAEPEAHVAERSDAAHQDPNFQQGIYVGDFGAQMEEEEEEEEEDEIEAMNSLMRMVSVPNLSGEQLEEVRRLLHTVSGDQQMLEQWRGQTALMIAVDTIGNDAVVAAMLLSAVASQAARKQNVKKHTALMIAVICSRKMQTQATLARLLAHESGSYVARMQDKNGHTALMLAVNRSRTTSTEETVAQLLAHESGSDVARMQDNNGETALTRSAEYSRTTSTEETVAQLLAHESGSDVARMQDNEGFTALMCAVYSSRTTSTKVTVAQLLAHESGSDVARMQDRHGGTALMLAAAHSRKTSTERTVIQLLRHESGSEVARMQDNMGYTALMAATQGAGKESQIATVARLLRHESGNAVICMRNNEGLTALMIAEHNERRNIRRAGEVVRILKQFEETRDVYPESPRGPNTPISSDPESDLE